MKIIPIISKDEKLRLKRLEEAKRMQEKIEEYKRDIIIGCYDHIKPN